MTQKPADQTSNQPNGSGDEVDLGADLDGDGTGTDGNGSDGDTDDGDQGDGGQLTIEQQIQAGIRAALPTITSTFQSEMDRRINGALAKANRKNGQGQQQQKDDEQDGDQSRNQQQAAPAADVRGARIAFREYLPMEIRTFSTEEQALATEFGQSRIRALAHDGFEDEDEAGRQAAQETAEFIKKARSLYSKRTKAVLKRQGALVETPGSAGGQTPGQTAPPADLAGAVEAARKKDMELFPQRYQNAQQ